MPHCAVIFDGYTVEPAGLGVPPYMSAYVRYAWASLLAGGRYDEIAYLTVDDYRAAVGTGDHEAARLGFTDRRTYSLTRNANAALDLLASADLLVVIAGDAMPIVSLHAENASPDEIAEVARRCPGHRIAVGPSVQYLRNPSHPAHGLFHAFHEQTFTPENLLRGSGAPVAYPVLEGWLRSFDGLLAQIPWDVMAEIEVYRGCTRRVHCSFCNEPIKNKVVDFRPPEEIIHEVGLLHDAGVRHFRLGQQTCFFSYYHRSVEKITRLLAGIRERCPRLETLHIDNVDALAAATVQGRRIARVTADTCTEGNCAPMGIESFDSAVVSANHLTCTPDVLYKAMENILEAGAEVGPLGQPKLLPGVNLVYGLMGQTRRTHYENLRGLLHILDSGYQCHRTNVRQALVCPGTELEAGRAEESDTDGDDFACWRRDIAELFERPMKERVFPLGHTLKETKSYFVDARGTWFRRLGSYPIATVEPGTRRALGQTCDVTVTGHTGRWLIGETAAPHAREDEESPGASAAMTVD